MEPNIRIDQDGDKIIAKLTKLEIKNRIFPDADDFVPGSDEFQSFKTASEPEPTTVTINDILDREKGFIDTPTERSGINSGAMTPKKARLPSMNSLENLATTLNIAVQKTIHTINSKYIQRSDYHAYIGSQMGDHVRFLEHLYPTLFSRFNVSASLGTIAHAEDDKISLRINAGSNNYAGFGSVDEHTEVLMKALMDSNIPLSDRNANQPFIEAYEAEMRNIYQSDDALHTVSGYTANMIAFAGMTTPETIWLMDSHSHNSMFMGARLAKPKFIIKFEHNDMDSLELRLQELKDEEGPIIVALEGLYSMSGCYPDAYRLAQLKLDYKFDILCDECHSLFSIGE